MNDAEFSPAQKHLSPTVICCTHFCPTNSTDITLLHEAISLLIVPTNFPNVLGANIIPSVVGIGAVKEHTNDAPD